MNMADRPVELADIQSVLKDFRDPESGRSITTFQQVKDIQVDGDRLSFTLELTSWAAPIWQETCEALTEKLRAALPGLQSVQVQRKIHPRPPQKLGEIGLTAKSVIVVGSGKGGVGKSTIAASLALGLQRSGCRVGLLDTDVYGPSIPHLLGLTGRPVIENNRLTPIYKNGMPVMSMGLLVPKDEAVIWRGPMLHGAVTQFLRDTDWGDLDYLIVDMPPGTGDIALTLSQLLPLTGAVVVCTPQDVALLDAVKAISMFRKVNIPILGIVENMSGFVCPDCGKRYDIFGAGGARRQAEESNVPFLGEVPIRLQIREHGDAGTPEAGFADPTIAPYFEKIAYRLVKNLAAAMAAAPQQPSLPILG
jgi:ATP-binding protein involved in chromosome partitioning